MQFSYRAMRAADINPLLEFPLPDDEPQWTPATLEAALGNGYVSQVACAQAGAVGDEAAIVGYAVASYALDQGDVQNIVVAPTYRGHGVGRQLLHQLISDMTENGVKTVFLEVRCSNLVAIRLYESSGFECIQKRRGYYPGADGVREDALVFSLARP